MENSAENKVKSFYQGQGWEANSKGDTLDAQLWEDLRPCAEEYVKACRRKILQHLPIKGTSILDAASGPIQYPEYLEYSRGFARRYCVDISQKALDEAKAKLGDKGEYFCTSILKLPFETNFFEAGLSLHTIYHIDKDQQEAAVRELLRVMKPGAPLIIIYSNPDRLLSKIKRTFKKQQDLSQEPLYFHAHPLSWWRRFNDVATISAYPWRMLTAKDGRTLIPDNGFGKFLYKQTLAFENSFIGSALHWGAYPMLVLKKKSGK